MIDINGSPCHLTKIRYTCEDGFEISILSDHAVDISKGLLDKGTGKVWLSGLCAHDCFRIETSFFLYINDMEKNKILV